MALPSKYGIEKKINSMAGLSAYENGGKGSGNFGHSGRPGEVGGSGGGYAGIGSSKADKIEKMIDRKVEARRKIAETEALHGTGEMSGEEAAERIADLKAEEKGQSKPKEKKGGEISLRGKSLYEKVHMIQPGDTVYIKPQDNLPNFDKKIKVDYIQDGTIHYGSSETSDGYTYPAWAIKDITKIERKKNEIENVIIDAVLKSLNGGKGSGNFGHAGRPGEVGGSSSDGLSGISKALATQKKFQDQAKIVQEDIEDRIGQKVKKGEEYTVWDEASTSRFKFFHGEDGTEYTYDKGNGLITKTNPKTGDQEVVAKQDTGSYDYSRERSGVSARDGFRVAREFDSVSAELATARTNLKMLEREKDEAYKDLSGRGRFMDRSSEISRSLHYAESVRKSMKMSKESKEIFKAMESELKSILDKYRKLGTKKYFDPELNHEN